MNSQNIRYTFHLVRALLGLYGIWFAFMSRRDPAYFVNSLSIEIPRDHRGRELPVSKIKLYARRALALIGIGVFIYFAAFVITDAIPHGIRLVDDDGENAGPYWEIAHWTVTVIGTLLVVDFIERMSRLKAKELRDKLDGKEP